MWGMEEELQVVSRVARYALEIDTTDATRSAVVVKELRKEFKDDGACLKVDRAASGCYHVEKISELISPPSVSDAELVVGLDITVDTNNRRDGHVGTINGQAVEPDEKVVRPG